MDDLVAGDHHNGQRGRGHRGQPGKRRAGQQEGSRQVLIQLQPNFSFHIHITLTFLFFIILYGLFFKARTLISCRALYCLINKNITSPILY